VKDVPPITNNKGSPNRRFSLSSALPADLMLADIKIDPGSAVAQALDTASTSPKLSKFLHTSYYH
jgi:hypothetical protein